NRSHWSTSKTPSYTKSVSWQHHPSSSPKLIIPQSGDSSSTTSNIGMGFKKRTTDDATFLKPNSAEKIRWSTDEMQPDKGLEMTVALRETDAGQGVPGNFRALATFNFIYQ
ncbi:fimbrial protein, partial [Shigella sonnei]|uniref:fimbrial protein n=1 Tax=Shigella sonnei TaxID=624 RepID=UPI0020A659BA